MNRKIAVFFPGMGYTTDKPLLYYARKLAKEAGYECLPLQYTASQKITPMKTQEERAAVFMELYAQTEAQLANLAWDGYDDVLFVSKSMGTIVATAYACSHKLGNARHVLYTPLQRTYLQKIPDGIAFIGTCDPWSDAQEIAQVSAQAGVPVEIYEGCDHSMESGSILRDLETLQNIMEKTQAYLAAK